jgi:hypothetical protein
MSIEKAKEILQNKLNVKNKYGCYACELKDEVIRQALDELSQPELTDDIHSYSIERVQAHLIANQSDIIYAKAERIKELEQAYINLRHTVEISCNPPDDCNDVTVLKTYMKACLDSIEDLGI